MATYKTPGVYIEEIPLFPPSVAQVETAIPAFIGYTQKAERNGTALPLTAITVGGGTVNVSEPIRITSLLEYVTYFGTGPKEALTIKINDTMEPGANPPAIRRRVISAGGPASVLHSMYYHMQMYFANGGGPCYIISVGDTTGNSISAGNLTAGLEVVKKLDEPTLLIFPQAVSLGAGDLYDIYDTALMQANELKDRFVVMDCHNDDFATLRADNG